MSTQRSRPTARSPAARRVGRRARRRPCRPFDRRHTAPSGPTSNAPTSSASRWPGPHVRTHAAMFAAALRRRRGHELVGQLFRIIVAAPGSITGKYPVGNTGGADVSAFEPMPIPEDLQPLLPDTVEAS